MRTTKNYNEHGGDTTVIEGKLIVKGELIVDEGGTVTGMESVAHDHADATTSKHGFMSIADKKKLDGVAANANAYTHPDTSGNKHIPTGGAANQVLKWASDGTASWGNLPQATESGFGVVKQAAQVTDSVAEDVATLKGDFNALLAKLRAAGIIKQ